jgi:NAD dependent epimerase/dehydratase family enzyme
LLLDVAETDGIRNVWIRSGVVLGRQGGLIGNIFWQFFFGLGGRMGSGQQPLAWIHVKDLAELIKFSIEDDNVTGVINGVAPQLISNQVKCYTRTKSDPFLPNNMFCFKQRFMNLLKCLFG